MGLPGVDWTTYNRRRQTPLTVVMNEFKARWGRVPSPTEMDYIVWSLGGTTEVPKEIGVRLARPGLLTRMFPGGTSGRAAVQTVTNKIDEIVEQAAYKLGYDPYEESLLGTPQTAAEFMKNSFSVDELFPEYVTGMDTKAANQDLWVSDLRRAGQLVPQNALSNVQGDLFYDEFYAAVKGHLDAEPTEGQLNAIRHFYFSVRYGQEAKSYLELKNGIDAIFKNSAYLPYLNEILTNSTLELSNLKDLGMAADAGEKPSRYLLGGGVPSLKQALQGEKPVVEEDDTLVGIYNAKYGGEIDKNDEDYLRDIAALTALEIEIPRTFNRNLYSERVMRVLVENINPDFLDPMGFNQIRLNGAINTALDNLVESGELPATAISDILNKSNYMERFRNYIQLRGEQDSALHAMTGQQAVEYVLTEIAPLFTEIEDSRVKDKVIAPLIADEITKIEIQDEGLEHTAAIKTLSDRTDEMIAKVLIDQAVHEQQQDELERTVEGHKREEFDFESAVSDIVARTWQPLHLKSIANIKEAAAQEAEDTRRLREINDAAMYVQDQKNIAGWDTYKRAAQLAWTAQGKDPTEFSAALMQRFTDNGSDPSLALGALSRSLFESGAFGTTTPEGAIVPTELKTDFTALLEGQAVKEKSLKTLSGFSSVEMAIASPVGRAALEAMAPGLTGEDQRQIDYLQGEIDKIAGGMEYAQRTPEELQAEIDKIKARPAERFKAVLDARAKGIPLPDFEAQFGYDTGGVEISQEVWANALAEKEKMRLSVNVEALMASVEEWQRPDVYKFLAEEGGLELLRGQYEAGFAEPDQYYYAAVAKAREAAGLVGVDTDEPLVEPEPYFDAYPELTEPGTYEVSPGVTVTIPEGGKKPPPEELEPGELSRRTLFAQTEGFERARSVERRKARGETFQKFLSTALPEAMKARTARIAGFKGSKLVKGTALTGGRRVRF